MRAFNFSGEESELNSRESARATQDTNNNELNPYLNENYPYNNKSIEAELRGNLNLLGKTNPVFQISDKYQENES